MNTKMIGAASAAALLLAGGLIAGPASADDWSSRQSTQNNKNLMRNLGVGLGVAAAYEALQGKGTNALLLGAGAALAGSQYEKDRKQQSDDSNWHRYGYRDDHRYDRYDRNDGRYDRFARNDHRR